MHLHGVRIRNFRRLKDVYLTFEPDISILVGANNSGKTSAAHALHTFAACSKDAFSVHDFNADCWELFDALATPASTALSTCPTISVDLWFHVEAADLARVVNLLPSLSWSGTLVGLRIEFAPKDLPEMIERFNEDHQAASANARQANGRPAFHPWPKSMMEYLRERLTSEFELRYFVLDQAQCDAQLQPQSGYDPLPLLPDGNGRGGAQIVKSLVQIDCLQAQRHLTDSDSGSRAEDLSKCLSRFYKRLKQREPNYGALEALADSEAQLDEHLDGVFADTLEQLSTVGYPGLDNPRLLIRSALNPAALLSAPDGARVHYVLGPSANGGEDRTLPDRYNGLGFKNLIYIVIDLLDRHAKWLETEDERPPLHIVFIEEPEAHMHAQLQQAFIRKVLELLKLPGEDTAHYTSQVVVTTHSPHIVYERGFKPVRYFRRKPDRGSAVLNLSEFYSQADPVDRDFLEKYMKLTHCDLFFADAAILVEGNVERLLMPLMISMHAERLKAAYISILEIGGAFGHRFKSLIDFLGLPTLIVTDIDSVLPPPEAVDASAQEVGVEEEEEEEESEGNGKACLTNEPGAVTSNQTLIQWLPRKRTIADLLAATPAERFQNAVGDISADVRVVYQTSTNVTWGDQTEAIAGRTMEEAFAFENLTWCQDVARKGLGLHIPRGVGLSLADLTRRLHHRVRSSSFNKTDFALGLLSENQTAWRAPAYIVEGLTWLAARVTPEPETNAPAETPAATTGYRRD
jgi:predicted ATP-dependent endonuclease of OLD family